MLLRLIGHLRDRIDRVIHSAAIALGQSSSPLALATLGDARAQTLFALLRQRFAADANALKAMDGLEAQWKAVLSPKP